MFREFRRIHKNTEGVYIKEEFVYSDSTKKGHPTIITSEPTEAEVAVYIEQSKPAKIKIDLVLSLREFVGNLEGGSMILLTHRKTMSEWLKTDVFVEGTFNKGAVDLGNSDFNLLLAIINQDKEDPDNPLHQQTDLVSLLFQFFTHLKTKVKVDG